MHLAVRRDEHASVAAVVRAARLGQRRDGGVIDAGVSKIAYDVLPAGLQSLRSVLDVTGCSEVDRHERAVDRVELREGACVHGGLPAPRSVGLCRSASWPLRS